MNILNLELKIFSSWRTASIAPSATSVYNDLGKSLDKCYPGNIRYGVHSSIFDYSNSKRGCCLGVNEAYQ